MNYSIGDRIKIWFDQGKYLCGAKDDRANFSLECDVYATYCDTGTVSPDNVTHVLVMLPENKTVYRTKLPSERIKEYKSNVRYSINNFTDKAIDQIYLWVKVEYIDSKIGSAIGFGKAADPRTDGARCAK